MLYNSLIKSKNYFKYKNIRFYNSIRNCLFPMYQNIRNKKLLKFKGQIFKDIIFENINYKLLLDNDNGFVDQEIFWKGVYEEEVMSCLKTQIDFLFSKEKVKYNVKNIESHHESVVFLDIGCNIGQELIFAASINKNIKAIGFEPLSHLCKQINASIEINNLSNAKVYNVAMGNEDQEINIKIPEINIGGSSIVRDASNTNCKLKVEKIKVRHADNFLQEQKIDKVDIIKIDVEGYEYEVLDGLRETLQKYSPIILIEYSPVFYVGEFSDRGEKTLRLMSDLGYTYTIIDGDINTDQANLLFKIK